MALRELADLRQDAAALCADLARIELAVARGTPFPQTVAEIVRAHRPSCSHDGLAQVVEALARASAPGRTARLASLRDFLVRARALELDPGAAQELLEFPRRPSVRLHGDPGLHGALPPIAAERELPTLREREERADMEAALAQAERGAAAARSAAWEAAQSALSELAAGDPLDAALALHERGWIAGGEGSSAGDGGEKAAEKAAEKTGASSRPPDEGPKEDPPHARLLRTDAPPESEVDAVTRACERFLRDTDSLAHDLGGWLLERETGARATPSGAERHDLLRFLHAPRCAGAFPAGELLRTVRRWAEMLRLDLAAGGMIHLEEDDGPLQPAGGRSVAFDPPHEIRIVLRPAEGPYALGNLLAAVGRAQLRAGPPPDAPPEDLWLGESAVEPGCAALLSGLLLDARWLRRCAHADLPRDDERTIAMAALLDARICAARALASLEAHRGGLGARAEQAYRELHARAALSDLPPALVARELDPWLAAWGELRGRALAAAMRSYLRERFDEDWWRNPRALGSLQGLWSRGGRPTAVELWREISVDPSVEPLSRELARACE